MSASPPCISRTDKTAGLALTPRSWWEHSSPTPLCVKSAGTAPILPADLIGPSMSIHVATSVRDIQAQTRRRLTGLADNAAGPESSTHPWYTISRWEQSNESPQLTQWNPECHQSCPCSPRAIFVSIWHRSCGDPCSNPPHTPA